MAAKKRKPRALHQRLPEKNELPYTRIEKGLCFPFQGKRIVFARDSRDHLAHQCIVRVYDPTRSRLCRSEEPRLVRIVFLDARIPVEMVRTEVGEDSDQRFETVGIVQLKGRHLERNP